MAGVDDKERGLYPKYSVIKIDDPDGKHDDCWYFVLDPKHDKYALPALMAYQRACAEEYPLLSEDLADIIRHYTGG